MSSVRKHLSVCLSLYVYEACITTGYFTTIDFVYPNFSPVSNGRSHHVRIYEGLLYHSMYVCHCSTQIIL